MKNDVVNDSERVAIDSNAMTKLIDALASISAPASGPECETQLALVRSFFYMPSNSAFHLTPTVDAEYLRISSDIKLRDHISWASCLLCQVIPAPEPKSVLLRAHELNRIHTSSRNLNDCKVLAECELSMMDCLITDDKTFIGRLRDYSPSVRLYTPQDYWRSLNIEKGSLPKRIPHIRLILVYRRRKCTESLFLHFFENKF